MKICVRVRREKRLEKEMDLLCWLPRLKNFLSPLNIQNKRILIFGYINHTKYTTLKQEQMSSDTRPFYKSSYFFHRKNQIEKAVSL